VHKLDKPLYHGTSRAAAALIHAYGFKAPIHLTEDKGRANRYARAATAYLEKLAKDEGARPVASGCALFTFSSVPDRRLLVPDDYNLTDEPGQWKYLDPIIGSSHFSVDFYPLIITDEFERLRLECFAIGMWRNR